MLEVENLTKSFGGLRAIGNVTVGISRGELVGLIGPNGAGKTTLINLITGFLKPDSGSIKFKGEEIGGLKPYKVARKHIARTFQIVRSIKDLSTLDNVRVACLLAQSKSPDQRAMEILEQVGLKQQRNQLAGNLNFAELKLLEIGRAMACEPELLLLDEPFAGVSVEMLHNLESLIQTLHENQLTILLIEHVLRPLMRLSERVIVIRHGEKIADGTPRDVSLDKNVIEAYLGASNFA